MIVDAGEALADAGPVHVVLAGCAAVVAAAVPHRQPAEGNEVDVAPWPDGR